MALEMWFGVDGELDQLRGAGVQRRNQPFVGIVLVGETDHGYEGEVDGLEQICHLASLLPLGHGQMLAHWSRSLPASWLVAVNKKSCLTSGRLGIGA